MTTEKEIKRKIKHYKNLIAGSYLPAQIRYWNYMIQQLRKELDYGEIIRDV